MQWLCVCVFGVVGISRICWCDRSAVKSGTSDPPLSLLRDGSIDTSPSGGAAARFCSVRSRCERAAVRFQFFTRPMPDGLTRTSCAFSTCVIVSMYDIRTALRRERRLVCLFRQLVRSPIELVHPPRRVFFSKQNTCVRVDDSSSPGVVRLLSPEPRATQPPQSDLVRASETADSVNPDIDESITGI